METCIFDSELERYLAESPISRKQNRLILWKTDSSCYKGISCVAQHLLCMPASEKIFSKARSTVTKLSCLKPKHVDASVFLNKNLNCHNLPVVEVCHLFTLH